MFSRIHETVPMELNTDEVSDVRWASFEQLTSLLESSKDTITPWFHMIASRILVTHQGWDACASLDAKAMGRIISNNEIVRLSQ